MAKRKPSRGLGDSIEAVAKSTGIKKVVDVISDLTGIDCGCEERKLLLNKLFPYRKPECLNDDDKNYLKSFYENNVNVLTPIVQRELSKIYLNVFKVNLESSNCSSCWRDYVSQLRKVYDASI
jgi:hypothetical protein